jgi:hypothetical protein
MDCEVVQQPQLALAVAICDAAAEGMATTMQGWHVI